MSKNNKISIEEKKKIDEIIENIDDVSSIGELEIKLGMNISYEDIKRVIKTMENKHRSLIGWKNHYDKEKDYLGVERCKSASKDIKVKLEKIIKMRQEHFEKVGEKQISKGGVSPEDRKQKLICDIRMIDYFYNEDIKQLFDLYITGTSYDEKIEILTILSDVYDKNNVVLFRLKKDIVDKAYLFIAKENNIDGKLRDNKEIFNKLLSEERYSEFADRIEEISIKYRKSKLMYDSIRKLITLENNKENSLHIDNYEEPEENYIELLGEELPIYFDFETIIKKINNGEYISLYGIQLEENIPKEIEEFFEKVKNCDYNRLTKIAILGRNLVRNKRLSLEDDESLEKAFLKKIETMFKKVKPEIILYEDDTDTSVYYKIMEGLIYNDDNYFYIDKLLENNDAFKDCKMNGEHILMFLLDQFIYNYKLKLINQSFNYVEPVFYKEVIKMFFAKGASLNKDKMDLFCCRLDEFEEYCKNKKYACLSDVLGDIEEVKNSFNHIEETTETIDKAKLKNELAGINSWLMDDIVDYCKRRGGNLCTDDENTKTFMFNEMDNFAFSINYSIDGNVNFGIHLLDITKLINESSEVWKAICEGKKVLPRFNNLREFPVVSFKVTLDSKNKLSDISIDNEIIKINSCYGNDDIYNYRDDETLKQFVKFLHIMNLENDFVVSECDCNDINLIVSNILSNFLGDKFESYDIPFIYEKVVEDNEQLIQDNHNATCQLLSRIPKKEAHQIFDILDHASDKYYVPSFHKEGNIVVDTDSLLGVYLLNVINQIRMGTYSKEAEMEKIDKYIKVLNGNREYLPSSIIKSNDKKLVKMNRVIEKEKPAVTQ